ncbi:MAG: hypothetical protein H0W34_01745 [Pyrinomonadaceae bacterium]|jgi:hypothetical protein|nr:hypothetical protein [Pyrinomonadaceae bacterium]MBA3570702.1 hypothetical protein [Pyrinomonadaceae bacterium]MDQ3174819.1 hypothetical protein [Acidobacteriota bacterium]
MTTEWSEKDTTTHQDHVVAHVLGATMLGYFIHDEALYVLLDIGFIWVIYLDGEMGFLPHPVAVGELDADEEKRREIQADIELLVREGLRAEGLRQLTHAPVNCLIEEVTFHTRGDERRLLIAGKEDGLTVDTSLSSGEMKVRGI